MYDMPEDLEDPDYIPMYINMEKDPQYTNMERDLPTYANLVSK